MKKIVFILFILAGGLNAFAQTTQDVATQINAYLESANYWRHNYSPDDTSFGHTVNPADSVTAAHVNLFRYITQDVAKVPGILRKPPAMPENSDMGIVTSDDKKLAIYSWDVHSDGKLRFYYVAALVQGSGGKVMGDTIAFQANRNWGDASGGEYEEIMSLTDAGTTYYLAVHKTNTSEKELAKVITAYTIEGNELKEVNMFQRSKSMKSISYLYDYMSNYDFDKMKEVYNVHLGKGSKKLYVPEVENMQMTGRWEVYNFEGGKFVFDKVEK